MENASKALMMAGAILITIMIFGMAMYFYAQYSEFPEKQGEAIKLAQIAKFNQEYESYYKEKMYGTDVVTIMNKVISNNKKYADPITGKYEINADNHFINVEITLLKDVRAYAVQYRPDPTFEPADNIGNYNQPIETITYDKNQTIRGYVNNKGEERTFQLGVKLSASKKITLLDAGTHSKFITNNETVEKFFSEDETYKIRLSISILYIL